MKIDFLAVCTPNTLANDFKQISAESLNTALQEHYESYGDDSLYLATQNAGEMVKLNWLRQADFIDNGNQIERPIFGFEINFILETDSLSQDEFVNVLTYLSKIIERFGEEIREYSSIKHLLKFFDGVFLEQNLAHMREVFVLEMQLRQTLSIIYLSAFADENFYELLRFETTKPQDSYPKDKEVMRKFCENEFYHLTFKQYYLLNKRKNLTSHKELIELVIAAADFEALRQRLTADPIIDENDKDLISSLKETSPKIEEFRNCVAHNRNISKELFDHYRNARQELEERLTSFFLPYRIDSPP